MATQPDAAEEARNKDMDPDGVIESTWDEIVSSFEDMNLKNDLLRGIFAYGFERPSAIQQRAIKPIIAGFDVISQAQRSVFDLILNAISPVIQLDR